LAGHEVRCRLVTGGQRSPVRAAQIDVERADVQRAVVGVGPFPVAQALPERDNVDVSQCVPRTDGSRTVTNRQPAAAPGSRTMPPEGPQAAADRSVMSVISLGAKIRNGGPQKPVPRLV